MHTPNGRTVVLDVKDWSTGHDVLARAVRQAGIAKTASGADAAYLIVPGIVQSLPEKGVIAEKDLVRVLNQEMNLPELTTPHVGEVQVQTKPLVFIAMPFADVYDDTYDAIMHASQKLNVACKRVDREEYADYVMAKVEELIRASRAVVADFSESMPNVLYETGFARGVGKDVIPICSTDIKALPFDVAQWNVLPYKKGGTTHLREPLARRLKSVLNLKP